MIRAVRPRLVCVLELQGFWDRMLEISPALDEVGAARRRLKLLSGKLPCSVPGNAEVGRIPSKAQPGRAPEQIVVKLKTGLTTLYQA